MLLKRNKTFALVSHDELIKKTIYVFFHHRVSNVTYHITGMRKESTGVFHFKPHVR